MLLLIYDTSMDLYVPSIVNERFLHYNEGDASIQAANL